jgi:uncharacterized integral membrane protein
LRIDHYSAIGRALTLCLVFLLITHNSKAVEIWFVEIPEGIVDEELRAEVDDKVKELVSEHNVALGVTVLEGATREEALELALKPRGGEHFVDLVIHLVLSTAGPDQDGHLVRVNLPQQQDDKVLVQPFFNAFGRCRDKNLDVRIRQLLAEVTDQVEVFVLQRGHEQGKFSSTDVSKTQPSLAVPPADEESPSQLWLIIGVVMAILLVLILGIVFLLKAVGAKELRFERVTISQRLQAPFAGGSPYLLKYRKKSRR